MDVNFWQFPNASAPMLSTEYGIDTLVRLEQLQNASCRMLYTGYLLIALGRVMDVGLPDGPSIVT